MPKGVKNAETLLVEGNGRACRHDVVERRLQAMCYPEHTVAPLRKVIVQTEGRWMDVSDSGEQVDVWSLIDPTVMPHVPSLPESNGDSESRSKPVGTGWSRRKWIVCTIVAILFWSYAFLNVFVLDTDSWVASSLGPVTEVLVRYRLFVVLGILALLVLRLKQTGVPLLYVALFPVVVPTVLLPWALIRSKSWNALFATVHVISSLIYQFRFRFVASVLVLTACLLTIVSPVSWLTGVAAGVLVIALIMEYGRAIKGIFSRSRFLVRQTEVIGSVIDSKMVQGLVSLDANLKSSSIQSYSGDQLQLFTQKVGYAVSLHRAVHLWASKLRGYGRSGFITLLNVLGYLWLFVESVVFLALINRAVYQIDPVVFSVVRLPTLLTWVSYAMAALAFNSIQAIEPVGDSAVALRIVAGFLGPVLLVTLFAGTLMSYKRERQQEQLDEAVEALRRQGKEVRERFHSDFGVTPEEARRRLEGLGLTIGLLVFNASLPDDYDSSEE